MDLGLTSTTMKIARDRLASIFYPGNTTSTEFTKKVNFVLDRFHSSDGWIGGYATFRVDVTTDKTFFLPFYLDSVLHARFDKRPGRVQSSRYEFIHDGLGEITSADSIGGTLIDLGFVGIPAEFPATASTIGVQCAAADYGKKVRILGYDASGNRILDSTGSPGEEVTLASGTVVTTNTFASIQGIQKELTAGRVTVRHTTAAETLAVLEPWMLAPSFRGYRCVDLTVDAVLVYCKRRAVPVSYEEDYIFPGNINALRLGLHAYNFEEAGQLSEADAFYLRAIEELNQEATRYRGGAQEHLSYAPWGEGISGIRNPR